jgi:hypothetical protein
LRYGAIVRDLLHFPSGNFFTPSVIIRFSVSGNCLRANTIAAPLLRFITEELPVHDDPTAPLFPRAYENVQRLGRVGSLSRQFHELLVRAGLVTPEERHAKEEGTKRRIVHTLSFHSLRHTTTSMLKNAGVNSAIVMDVVGHQSTAISTHYTKIDSDAKRRAIQRMPDILSPIHGGNGNQAKRLDTVQAQREPEGNPNSKPQSPKEPLESWAK